MKSNSDGACEERYLGPRSASISGFSEISTRSTSKGNAGTRMLHTINERSSTTETTASCCPTASRVTAIVDETYKDK